MKLEEIRAMKKDVVSGYPAIKAIITAAHDELLKLEEAGQAPYGKSHYPGNYSNSWEQACYIYRYTYAFAYEYYLMYLNTLPIFKDTDAIKVLSIGCGNMVDAWAIGAAAGGSKKIQYTGVDYVKWDSKYIPLLANEVKVYREIERAGNYINQQETLDFDILVFPKSLGDMYRNSYNDYTKMRRGYRDAAIKKDRFCIAFSLIDYYDKESSDSGRKDEIIEIFLKKGYKYEKFSCEHSTDAISNSSPSFPMIDQHIWADSIRLAGKQLISRRSYEKYYIYYFTKV